MRARFVRGEDPRKMMDIGPSFLEKEKIRSIDWGFKEDYLEDILTKDYGFEEYMGFYVFTYPIIFSSGKMVCTGAKSEKEAKRAVMKVVKELKKGGIIIISKPELKIQNIVASGGLGGMIDLEKAAYSLGHSMYEPEQFPGLIYRMGEPKVVILLFASGKLVCTGAKKEPDVYVAVDKLHSLLEETSLIFYE